MAKVNISNVVVKDNPAKFMDQFQFEITFECIENLNDDLEWKIIYVGSAESEAYDQTLDTVVVGPIIAGRHMFVFEADPPLVNKIPPQDVVGVTVVLLTCSYLSQEFIRVGYYVNNDYEEPELKENPPLEPDFKKLQRNILATCPRVTRFKIDWGDGGNENQPPPMTSAHSGPSLLDEQHDSNIEPLKYHEIHVKSTTDSDEEDKADNEIFDLLEKGPPHIARGLATTDEESMQL